VRCVGGNVIINFLKKQSEIQFKEINKEIERESESEALWSNFENSQSKPYGRGFESRPRLITGWMMGHTMPEKITKMIKRANWGTKEYLRRQ